MDERLTKRELEILLLIIGEKTSADIAAELYISKNTVENHRKSMMAKTGAKSVVGLLKWAMDNGITLVSLRPFTVSAEWRNMGVFRRIDFDDQLSG